MLRKYLASWVNLLNFMVMVRDHAVGDRATYRHKCRNICTWWFLPTPTPSPRADVATIWSSWRQPTKRSAGKCGAIPALLNRISPAQRNWILWRCRGQSGNGPKRPQDRVALAMCRKPCRQRRAGAEYRAQKDAVPIDCLMNGQPWSASGWCQSARRHHLLHEYLESQRADGGGLLAKSSNAKLKRQPCQGFWRRAVRGI